MPGPSGRVSRVSLPGIRQEIVVRILRVDAALDRRAAPRDVLLRERQPPAGRDLDLQPHQVEAGHQFRDRMLHLQARVHFQEVEAAVLIHQELHRAGVVVAGGARGADRRLAHRVRASRDAARPAATGTPRSPSDAAAGWSTRARRGGPCCRGGRRAAGFRCGAAARSASRRRPRRCGRRARPRSTASRSAASRSASRSTRRMPLPPPPATALSRIGIAVLRARTARSLVERDAVIDARARPARRPRSPSARAAVFEPIARIESADGPMKTMPGVLAGRGEIGVLAEEAVARDGSRRRRACARRPGCGRCADSFRPTGAGPTCSASSAMRTCSEVRSASE